MKHLAQLNVAKLLKPIDHPQIAEFVENLDRINELAEKSNGFVWRLQDEYGNATAIKAFDDPLIIVNMSVWESIEDLKNYVYKSGHTEIMRKRKNWFEKLTSHNLVMWWIDKGHIPTLTEGIERLEHLNKNGGSEYAFGFKNLVSTN